MEVNDARELLLPDLEAVEAGVVLDVLEGAAEAVYLAVESVEPLRQLPARLGAELELGVQGGDDLLDELLADAVLEQLLRVERHAADERRLHLQDALRVQRDRVRVLGDLVAQVQLREVLQLLLGQQRRHF